MSRQDILDAYLNGEISRRTFVQRLVVAGVAVSAAGAYAELLHPRWASAGQVDCHIEYYDQYGHYNPHEVCEDDGGDDGDGHYGPGDGHYGPGDGGHGKGKPGPKRNPGPPKDKTAPHTKLHLPHINLKMLLLTGRFIVQFSTNEPGDVQLTATLLPGGGKHHPHLAKNQVVGRGRTHFSKPGGKRVPIKLTKHGRKTLRKLQKHHKKGRIHQTLAVTAVATDKAGNPRTTRMALKFHSNH